MRLVEVPDALLKISILGRHELCDLVRGFFTREVDHSLSDFKSMAARSSSSRLRVLLTTVHVVGFALRHVVRVQESDGT